MVWGISKLLFCLYGNKRGRNCYVKSRGWERKSRNGDLEYVKSQNNVRRWYLQPSNSFLVTFSHLPTLLLSSAQSHLPLRLRPSPSLFPILCPARLKHQSKGPKKPTSTNSLAFASGIPLSPTPSRRIEMSQLAGCSYADVGKGKAGCRCEEKGGWERPRHQRRTANNDFLLPNF